MTDRNEALLSLIRKLEEATGPSRALDCWIAAHMGVDGWTVQGWAEVVADRDMIDPEIPSAPAYTASLDAAIPGESIRKVERKRFNNGTVYWIATHDGMGMGCGFKAHAATEPLARRIAALRIIAAKLSEASHG